MDSAEERKARAAEEMAETLDARERARVEAERRGLTNLNQGLESSGHEASHPGINWGPTYRKRRKAKKGSKNQK